METQGWHGGGQVVNVVNVVQCRIVQNTGRFGEWYAPESIVILALLENGRLFAGDGDVNMVMHCGSFVTFVENGDITIVSKCSNAE